MIGIEKPVAPADWTHKPQHMSCSHTLSTKRKRKHLVNRKFPRKQTPWNSHRPTPDDAVHRPGGITGLHRTMKKRNTQQ